MKRRSVRDRLYFYDTIADRFDVVMNAYDLQRRLDIVFDELCPPERLRAAAVLDVGAGTGWFSQRALASGACVVSTDIAVAMLHQTRVKCNVPVVASDACHLALRSESFDVVIASECIEHTLDPLRAVREMHRVLRPGGSLIVTVPNRLWRFSATIAAWLKVRPYEGLEHWVGWGQLQRTLTLLGMRIVVMKGFHMFPPIFRITWPWLRGVDRYGSHRALGPLMLNIAVKADKV